MVHDVARDTLVLHKSASLPFPTDLWEWRGNRWLARDTGIALAGMPCEGAAYDAARGVTLLLLRGVTQTLACEWDGRTATTAATPVGALNAPALAHDLARQQTVLFSDSGSTWTYDGTTWTLRAPATSPPPRRNAAIAYHPARARVVLFGGVTGTSMRNDTWEWDGSTWTPLPGTVPPPRMAAAMAPDPVGGGMLLQGGTNLAAPLSDTWRLGSQGWTQVGSGPAPVGVVTMAARNDHIAALATTPRGWELWSWRGSAWTRDAQNAAPEVQHRAAAASPDGNGIFQWSGGLVRSTTADPGGYTFLQGKWTAAPGSAGPPARNLHSLATNTSTRRTLLFGGVGNSVNHGDTWEWDGVAWTQHNVPGPSPRVHCGLAYDALRNRIVLFGGGLYAGVPLADTWLWDGAAWTQVATANAPSPRFVQAMAFDQGSGTTMLCGGSTDLSRPLLDTWTFDGTTWLQQPGTLPSTPRSLGFDPQTSRMLVFTESLDTLAWNPGWQQVAGPGLPVLRAVTIPNRLRLATLTETTGVSEFAVAALPQVANAGPACPGTTGAMVQATVGQPLLGLDLWLDVHRIPGAFAVLVLATRAASTGYGSCVLVPATDEALVFAPAPTNFASFRLGIPLRTPLIGLSVHAQAVAPDATAASGLGFGASNALTLTVGL